MADSDITTTLPIVIKRWRSRRGRMRTVSPRSCTANSHEKSTVCDPAIALLSEWTEMHHAAGVLLRLQQRQERRLLSQLQTGNADHVSSLEHNYEAARSEELNAMDAEEKLLMACAATSAETLSGVLAKLAVIASAGEGRGTASEFPWPQIQSVTADLSNILSKRQQLSGMA